MRKSIIILAALALSVTAASATTKKHKIHRVVHAAPVMASAGPMVPGDCTAHTYQGNPVYTGPAPVHPPGIQLLPLPVFGGAVGVEPMVTLRAPCQAFDPNPKGFFPDPADWAMYNVPHVVFFSK